MYIYIYIYVYIYIYICIYSLHKSNNYSLKSAQLKSIIYYRKKTMQKNFTWYLKFYASGSTIFQPGTTIIKKFTV